MLEKAKILQKQKSYDLARMFYENALTLAIELEIPLAQECQILKDQLEDELRQIHQSFRIAKTSATD